MEKITFVSFTDKVASLLCPLPSGLVPLKSNSRQDRHSMFIQTSVNYVLHASLESIYLITKTRPGPTTFMIPTFRRRDFVRVTQPGSRRSLRIFQILDYGIVCPNRIICIPNFCVMSMDCHLFRRILLRCFLSFPFLVVSIYVISFPLHTYIAC